MSAPTTPQHETAIAKLTLTNFAAMKSRKEKITVLTAYDAPSARLADAAGVDCLLVGDSAAMTVLGHDSTLPITVDEMLLLTRAVSRVTRRAFIVTDMPFGSFQVSDQETVHHAVRLLKEGGADAVKLEGAGQTLSRIEALLKAGIPVMGHIGLTPQSVTQLGGYKPQGRTATAARRLYEDALALERAGCFSIVLEAMPEPVAARVTNALSIPTIGIGAGRMCDGQVLVWHDLLGYPAEHVPRFVKQYADLGGIIKRAVESYVAEVRSGAFPETRHTYGMPAEEIERLEHDIPQESGTNATPNSKVSS